MVDTNVNVPKVEETVEANQQWLDRRTKIDDILGIIAELMIENNITQKTVLQKVAAGLEIIIQVDAETDSTEEPVGEVLIKPGDKGVSLSVCNSGDIGTFIINKTIISGIAKSDITAFESVIVVPGGTSNEPYVVPLSILIKGNKGVIAQDDAGNLTAVMKGNYDGSLETISVDSLGLMQADISKSEKNSSIETDKDVHFTGVIVKDDYVDVSLAGLTDNKIYVRGINVQAKQNLKFRLSFFGKDIFSSTDLNADSYKDDAILDLSDSENAFRYNNVGQYYLNVSDLNILYEDKDATNELHIRLQNLSPTDKAAGSSGEVQMDIKYAPRL